MKLRSSTACSYFFLRRSMSCGRSRKSNIEDRGIYATEMKKDKKEQKEGWKGVRHIPCRSLSFACFSFVGDVYEPGTHGKESGDPSVQIHDERELQDSGRPSSTRRSQPWSRLGMGCLSHRSVRRSQPNESMIARDMTEREGRSQRTHRWGMGRRR